jgi:hypothetical protein
VIGRVVLLADESAHYNIAGLTQLDRLLRTLEECFAPGLLAGSAPEVVVWWKSSNLMEQRQSRLAVTHRVAREPLTQAPSGSTLLLTTKSIFRRGVLARLLADPRPCGALALLEPEAFPADRESLARRVSQAPTDQYGWVLQRPEEVPAVERQVLRSTGKPTDGLVSRMLNRPVSQLVSRLLVQTRVTPNQISLVVLVVLAVSLWTLARGSASGFVIGMLLFHLASVLDGCDGEIARVKFLESPRGALLDTSVDLLGNFLLPFAIGLGLSRSALVAPELRNFYLVEGILTSAGVALGIAALTRARPSNARNDFNDFGSSVIDRFGVPRWLTATLQAIANLLRRDSYVVVFVVLAVLGAPEWILHFLAFGVAMHLPVIGWSWWTSSRAMASVKASPRN